jgi:hypothetical protein
MLTFADLIHALPTRGRNMHPIQFIIRGSDAFCNTRGRKRGILRGRT